MFRVSLEEWMSLYEGVRRRLGIDVEGDRLATRVLSSLLEGRGLRPEALEGLFMGEAVMVVGAGPSLDEALDEVVDLRLHERFKLIAADGATTALIERGVIPHAICSDLDGRVEDQLEANREGSMMVVHAHGDNVDRVVSYVPSMEGPIVGSTQVEPQGQVYNFGGFTDGDRCVFLAEWAGARLIALIGMDLGPLVGKHSKPWLRGVTEAWPMKRAKLEIARELLEWLAPRCTATLVSTTSGIRGFREVTVRELASMV